jgi:5'-nucleotidase/UDP-sugar diphosphatase
MATIPGGAGGFPQVSQEVRFTINAAARKSEGVTIKGKPIDPEKTYSMATNSYLAGGGDGYKILLGALDRYDTSTFQRDALIEYIPAVKKTLKPEIEGRIRMGAETSLPFFTPSLRDALPEITVSSPLCCAAGETPAH